MAMTRAQTETILVKRAGPLLVAAGMDGATVDGTNADLNDPIGRAIRHLGYIVGSIVAISDADVAQVTEAQYDEYLDVGTLMVLESILGNLDDCDITVGPRSEKLSQLAAQVERKINRLTTRLLAACGYGLAIPVARVIRLSFAEHGT